MDCIKCFILSFISILLATTIYSQSSETDSLPQKAPNIVLILADDLALMDFGIYGGEASTPNIDRLARRGTMFTNYHATSMCAPSRAMLMTGMDSHLTGVPNLPLFLPEEYVEQEGYEGILNNKVETVATLLKKNGYRTYISGKWHLGHTPTTLPSKRGFDRTYILDSSGADNWEHKAYLPTQSKPTWIKDGKEIELPKDFYSSRNLVDEMIAFMDEDSNNKDPFFSFLSFQAIHIPVQAPKEFIQKYEGVYDNGWDELRKKRFEKAKELGLISKDANLADMLPELKAWEQLTDEDKKLKAKAMAVNAAMIEAMDYHIGRYIEYLEQKGELDHTVFIITSDNGPEASDPSLVKGMGLWLKTVGYHTDIERLGQKGSWNFIGPQFASAAASPSSFFKFYTGEGGLRVPLIVSGKNLPKGQQKNAFSFVTDITPTILDIAGINQATLPDFTGKSTLPLILNKKEFVYEDSESVILEAAGQVAVFKGDLKLVKTGKPYGDDIWRLFNIKNDPGEISDISKNKIQIFENLKNEYKAYKVKYSILEMPKGYELAKELETKFKKKLKKTVLPWIIGFVLLLIGLFFWRRKRRRKSIDK